MNAAAPQAGPLPVGTGKKKRRWPRRLAVVLVLAAAALAAVKLLGGRQAVPAGNNYRPVQVIRRDMAVSVTGTATLEPADAYDVTALVSGEILEAPFEEFSDVTRGELLYAIDDSAVRDSVSGAVIGVAVANSLKAPPLVMFSAGVVGQAGYALGAAFTIGGAEKALTVQAFRA